MKKTVITIALATAALFGAAGTAHADTRTFLEDLRDDGWRGTPNGDASLVNNGRLVCEAIRHSGLSPKQIARQLYLSNDSLTDEGDAQEFVAISFVHLCPTAL
jgi:hypothetical protein